ncbi:hypothetical protein [Micromonospora sp. DT47]|uniref:hypothetical protein n=1 Tax=Micromonospora sp. DT47 TaxID=3393431 RepID=UPI003CF31FE1
MTHSDGLIRPGSPAPDFAPPATPDGRRTGPGQPGAGRRGQGQLRGLPVADVEPKGEVARRYGAYPLEQLGTDRRVVAG